MQGLKDILNQLLPHLWPFLVFFLIVSVYFFPLYEGKTLVQSDNIQLSGTMNEVNEYNAEGEDINWTNVQFSGMPLQTTSNKNFFRLNKSILDIFPQPVIMMIWMYLGFYILAIVVGIRPWLAGIAALAYSFSSFNIISIEVGHDNKVYAMAFMAPVFAGAILAYKGQFLRSLILTSVFLGFHIYYGHIQISYYLLILLLSYAVKIFIDKWKQRKLTSFFKGSAVLLIAAGIAIGGNLPRLWKLYEYGKVSNRGGSELTQDATESSSGGLDIDYALNWSNGLSEVFTIVIPYFHGGASGESLERDSEMGKVLDANGVPVNQINSVLANAPTYWGNQPFTQGPIYFGVLVVLLFVLAFWVLPRSTMIWGASLVVLALVLSMGKNVLWFSELFFYYVPLYNKFRSVTMIMCIPQLMFPFFGFLALEKLFRKEKIDKTDYTYLRNSIFVLLGLFVFFLLFKKVFFNFTGANDGAYGYPEWLLRGLKEDRISLFNRDIFRGILLVLIFSGGLWLWHAGRLSLKYLTLLLGIIAVLDITMVDRRYLGSDDFLTNRGNTAGILAPTQADLTIKQDSDYFRVFNTTRNITGDGITSNHHFSIGGYSAIKIQRYQELIERYLSQGNRQVLAMLNTKYFIVNGSNNLPEARRNPMAYGPAWIVDGIEIVKNADEEIAMLETVDLRSKAVVDDRFLDYVSENKIVGSSGTIGLVSYHPEHMEYEYQISENGFAVFSEIYYAAGWQAYIDGQPVSHIRCNYILRGMNLPAGNHTISFKYEPSSVVVGEFIQLVCGLLVLLMLLTLPWLRSIETRSGLFLEEKPIQPSN